MNTTRGLTLNLYYLWDFYLKAYDAYLNKIILWIKTIHYLNKI